MNTEYSLFLIMESSIDDISNMSRFVDISLNNLVTESSGESFVQKIRRMIQFVINKIKAFFENMFKNNSEAVDQSHLISRSKLKEVKTKLFSKVYDGSFDVVSVAEKVLNDVRPTLQKDIEKPLDEAEEFTRKYIRLDDKTDQFLGKYEEFTVNQEKGKQIIIHVTQQINNLAKIRTKLEELYNDIERSLKPNLDHHEQTKINNKMSYLNQIAGLIFNTLRAITNLAKTDMNKMISEFGKSEEK